MSTITPENGVLNPSEWNVEDVGQFLRINDCSVYSDNFIKKVGSDIKNSLIGTMQVANYKFSFRERTANHS